MVRKAKSRSIAMQPANWILHSRGGCSGKGGGSLQINDIHRMINHTKL